MSDARRPTFEILCLMSNVHCPMHDVRRPMPEFWCPISDLRSRCAMWNRKKKRTKKGPRDRQKFGRKIGQNIVQKIRETIGQKKWDEKTEHYIVAWEYEFIFECWKYLILVFLFQKVKILMKKRKIMLVTMATPISSHVKDKNSIFTARDKDMIF